MLLNNPAIHNPIKHELRMKHLFMNVLTALRHAIQKDLHSYELTEKEQKGKNFSLKIITEKVCHVIQKHPIAAEELCFELPTLYHYVIKEIRMEYAEKLNIIAAINAQNALNTHDYLKVTAELKKARHDRLKSERVQKIFAEIQKYHQ